MQPTRAAAGDGPSRYAGWPHRRGGCRRVAEGKVNTNADVKTKSVPQIVRDHTMTFFNGINLVLAILVMITGQYRNMLFMGVVLSNLVIGIVQELRAKRMVDRLTIITASDVTVIRNGEECAIPVEEVVCDDLVRISRGDQVPADGVVVYGSAAMNESLLTGESDAIPKVPDDEVLSGSFVDSGSLVFRVPRAWGLDSYASRINDEAKFVKAITSEIRDTLNWIIRASTLALVPVGIALFLRSVLSDSMDTNSAILTTVAAVVGMIPQGLVLLTSSVLAIATTRLGAKKVLVQQSYCVETLARVDVLCLDKTGTITTGDMEVEGACGAVTRRARRWSRRGQRRQGQRLRTPTRRPAPSSPMASANPEPILRTWHPFSVGDQVLRLRDRFRPCLRAGCRPVRARCLARHYEGLVRSFGEPRARAGGGRGRRLRRARGALEGRRACWAF